MSLLGFRAFLAADLFLLTTGVGFATGGTVQPATEGNVDRLYTINLPVGPNDRAITRYGYAGVAFPNGSEFDPNAVICGARVRTGHQSDQFGDRPLLVDMRLEDPNNPGFPEVWSSPYTCNGLPLFFPVGADSNPFPPQCARTGAPMPVGFVPYQDFTFNCALGVPNPRVAFFLTYKFGAPGSIDPCWLALELGSAPYNERALYYNSVANTFGPVTFGADGGNHWLEAVVLAPHPLSVDLRMHGAPGLPGDRGLPAWFIRGDPAGTRVDDFIHATITVDNATNGPISNQILTLVADRSVINPKLAPKDLSSTFRLISNPKVSLASGNPYSWAPGRTILRANIPATISGRFQSILPKNMSFTLQSTRATPPNSPTAKKAILGMRSHRGLLFDDTIETFLTVQSPSTTGDALFLKRSLEDLFHPRLSVAGSLEIEQLGIIGLANGGAGGLDWASLHPEDPIIQNAPDLLRILGRIGSFADGIADLRFIADGVPRVYLYPFSPRPLIPRNHESAFIFGFWFMAGETPVGGALVGSDRTGATIIPGSAFIQAGGALGLDLRRLFQNPGVFFLFHYLFPLSESGNGQGVLPSVRYAPNFDRRVLLDRIPQLVLTDRT